MSTYIKTLKDNEQNQIAPRTVFDAVTNSQGNTIQDVLDTKQDTLIQGNNVTINNSTISALKYYKRVDVTGVAGTSTTQLSSTYNVTDSSVNSYYDGMVVTFVLPVVGVSTYGSVFQINSLGYKPIVYGVQSIIGTRYPAGGQITMVYNSIQTAAAYLTKNTKTTITGCWQVCDYDVDTTDARALMEYNFRPYAGSNIYRYKLCLQDKDNRLQPIVITDQTTTTQVVKTVNTTPLRPEQIWLYNYDTNTSAASALPKSKLMSSDYGAFCAYNFNATIASYRMIYLKGSYDETTGLFTLDNSTDNSYYAVVPNKSANITLSNYLTSGSYYILVGCTNGDADNLQLFQTNPMYYFDGINLMPYEQHLVGEKSEVSVAATGTSTDEVQYITIDGVEKKLAGSSGGGTWGSITGTLSDQTDLQTELDTKVEYEDVSTIAGTVQYDADTLEGHDSSYFVPMSALADYIVEQNTSGIWTYRKWNSGVAECWGTKTVYTSIDNSWGYIYISPTIIFDNYPSNLFNTIPHINYSVRSTSSGAGVMGVTMDGGQSGSSSRPPEFRLMRATSYSSTATITISAIARGNWK